MTLFVQGATGRLGKLVMEECLAKGIAAKSLARPVLRKNGVLSFPALSELLASPKDPESVFGILDVSLPQGTMDLGAFLSALEPVALEQCAFLIVGTTGHSTAQEKILDDLGRTMAVIRVSNFSRGVVLLQQILSAKTETGATVTELARNLGFDLGMCEVHHTKKQDAPSGTAVTLARTAAIPVEKIASLRVGNVIGEHTIAMSGEGEELRFSHTANSRSIFASGAVDLAQRAFRIRPKPGSYQISDILGISQSHQ